MPIHRIDPGIDITNAALRAQGIGPDAIEMDAQELAERTDAAQAYAGESESHFVAYVEDCIDSSVKARADIRTAQKEFWEVFQENEPESFANKEAWQSRIITPKPFGSIQYAAAAIRKAFSPDFLSIRDERNPYAEFFWQRTMEKHLGATYSNFVHRFTRAVIMALAVGQSMEMIPTFISGEGLRWQLVEPWKIHRDPDAPPDDPQGGMYWVHQEWLDYHVLKGKEQEGRYVNVDRSIETEGARPDDPLMTREAIESRRGQIWERSNFRKMVLVSEFWGQVLSPKGELLLPAATCTVAGGRVIELPRAVPYQRLRWPGVSFSALPDLLRFDGRGLLSKSVKTVWEALNEVMNLHMDALKWIINPPREINVDALLYAEDVEDYPGKKYLVRDSMHGQQAIRTVDQRDNTNSVLANTSYLDQMFQRGTMSTDAVQGLPGWRQDMTYRESQMLMDQALGVYGLMGASLETGAVAAILAAKDVIQTYASPQDFMELFTEQEMMQYGLSFGMDMDGTALAPELTGTFHVSGMQALMKENETLKNLQEIIVPLANAPRFAPYIRVYPILKAIEERINLVDEGVLVDEQAAQALEMMEQQQMAMAAQMGPEMGADEGPPPEEVI